MSHACAVPGCGREAPPKGLVCVRHWALVPMSLKTALRRAFDPRTKRQSGEWNAIGARVIRAAQKADGVANAVPSMRALSIWQPWAWAIAAGHRPVENRSWAPPEAMLGQPLVLHAARRFDFEHEALVEQFVAQATGQEPDPQFGFACLSPNADRTGVIGVAVLDRVVDDLDEKQDPIRSSQWFTGRFGWVLRDADEFPDPIECPGKQGLWAVPPEVAAKVWYRMQIKKAMQS